MIETGAPQRLVTLPQTTPRPEHRLAAVPRFRVTDYVLPQVMTLLADLKPGTVTVVP